MKKILTILILSTLLISCNTSNQKEKELIKKENELLKRELEIQKKENQISKTKNVTPEKEVLNKKVEVPNEVYVKFANLMSSYTRKMDLVPNLVNIIKTNSNIENVLLENLIKSRSSLLLNLSSNELFDEDKISLFEGKENRFSAMLDRVISATKKYPKIQNNQNYLEILSQLEGTNNRIRIEKIRFNNILEKYNLNYPKFNTKTENKVKVEF